MLIGHLSDLTSHLSRTSGYLICRAMLCQFFPEYKFRDPLPSAISSKLYFAYASPLKGHTLCVLQSCAPSKLTQLRPWPIQSFGISIQFRPTLTLLSDTEIGCAFINADVAKTVTGDWRYL